MGKLQGISMRITVSILISKVDDAMWFVRGCILSFEGEYGTTASTYVVGLHD